MFTVKHAIMEILNKTKTLDEALSGLESDDQVVVIATLDLMKAKLDGSIDIIDTQANGQWSLEKNTLDYAKINAPKPSKPEGKTLDYGKMNAPKAKKPWAGAVDRKNAQQAKHQEWVDQGSEGSGETSDKPALDAIRDRQLANKSEDDVKQIKDKYATPKPKATSEAVTDLKEKYIGKAPKSDEQKVAEAKEKYNKDTKLKDEQPFKTNVKLAKP